MRNGGNHFGNSGLRTLVAIDGSVSRPELGAVRAPYNSLDEGLCLLDLNDPFGRGSLDLLDPFLDSMSKVK